MRRSLRILKFVGIALIALPPFGFVIMWLWNWLVPPIFGWHAINFWQALGLFLLSKLLFGGLHGNHGPNRHWRRRMMERWEKMTPEERDRFRQSMRGRCGPFPPPEPEAKATG